jgi:hypothetical protein
MYIRIGEVPLTRVLHHPHWAITSCPSRPTYVSCAERSARLPTTKRPGHVSVLGDTRNESPWPQNMLVPLSLSNEVDGPRDYKRNDDQCKDGLDQHEQFCAMRHGQCIGRTESRGSGKGHIEVIKKLWCPVPIIAAHLLGKQEVNGLVVGLPALLWASSIYFPLPTVRMSPFYINLNTIVLYFNLEARKSYQIL